MIEISHFDNGVTLAVNTLPHSDATAVGIWLLNGARHQRSDEIGCAHFLEHILFKGTQQLSTNALAQRFEAMGGHINAHTGRELTALHGLVPNQFAGELLGLFCEMLLTPRFNAKDVEIEKEVVLQEIAMVADDPEELLEEDLLRHCWPNHALGEPILGTKAAIETFSFDKLQRYLRHILCGRRILVVAMGGSTMTETRAACTRLSQLPEGTRPSIVAPNFQPAQLVRDYGVAQTCLHWLMPAPPVADDTAPQFIIANHILGGGVASRLFQEVREERGLVYGVQSNLDLYSDCGLWSIQTACEPENGAECRKAVEATVTRFFQSGPQKDELETTRSYVKSRLQLEQQNLEVAVERIARDIIYRDRVIEINEHIRRFDAVTAAEVMAALAEQWPRRGFAQTTPK